MKEKLKKIRKNNLFCFTLGLIIAGTVSVTAATFFPSNNVTYDNTESGLNSTDVQGAIDELYNACKVPEAGGNGILEKVDIVTSGDGLYEDEYEEGRFIFKGGNPNNYVTFNNETAGWRIISVESDKTIKIMRTASIEYIAWDTSNSNNWKQPATLNTYLNEDYLVNFLNGTAKNQIVAGNFSIGAVTAKNNNMSTLVSDENSNKWYGKIALPTVSEYLRTNSNKSSCGTLSLMSSNYSSCVSTGWMDTTSVDWWWWTLTPHSDYSNIVYYVHSRGYVSYSNSENHSDFAARPVVYLSSEVQIIGGDGTQSNPYRIE